MKISTRARYALRLMLDICRNSEPDRPVQLREIASRNSLSKGYLEQLVVALKTAQLVRSYGGRSGGYQLMRPPENISLLEIVEAVIGPIGVVECVRYPEECMQSDGCECRTLWELVNCRITDVLAEYSLDDLASREGVVRMTEELDVCRKQGSSARQRRQRGPASKAKKKASGKTS